MATEPRVITQLIPDLSSASFDAPSRRALLIAPFVFKDNLGEVGDAAEVEFETSKNNVYVLGFKVFVDGVEFTYSAATPTANQFTLYNTGVTGQKARVYFSSAPVNNAEIVFYYMYNEDSNGATIMEKAFEITPRLSKQYESMFGVVDQYNPFMICMNIAKIFGVRKFQYIPVPYLESDVAAATPNTVNLINALLAAKYVTTDIVCHIFSDSTANSLALTHVDTMSTSAIAEYRVLFAANPQTTLATQKTELQGYTTKRGLIVNTPSGNIDTLVGTEYITKGAGYLAWGLACRKVTFIALASTLTRKVIPGFQLTGKYLRDEREELNTEGGCTVRTIGTSTVQVAWAKTTAKSGLPEEEENSVVMIQDYARAFYEDELDKRTIGKILDIPKELNGFDINDMISWTTSISIYLKREGVIVRFQNVDFSQNETDSRQMDGSIQIKWPFPVNIVNLTISSYN